MIIPVNAMVGGDQIQCAKLSASLYGTRDAQKHWERVRVGTGNDGLFGEVPKTGECGWWSPRTSDQRCRSTSKNDQEHFHGQGSSCGAEGQPATQLAMLSRRFKWTRRCVTWEADLRRKVAIVKQLRLEGATGVLNSRRRQDQERVT